MADTSIGDRQPEYPNSPLARVVFEIRFPGEPAVECHRDDFFAVARDEFPLVFVPHVEPGKAPALSPYRFQRPDHSASLLTALNLFAYQTSQYPGFDAFSREALRWITAFAQRFEIQRLTRTGLRYTNIVPYAPGEVFPVSSFFNVGIKLGVTESSAFERFSLSAEIPTQSGGVLTVQVQQVQNETTGENAILLDFDVAMTGEHLTIEEVERYLDDSHTETKRLFEGLITDRYRTYLRGEGVE